MGATPNSTIPSIEGPSLEPVVVTPEYIEQAIQAGLACEHVQVAGDGQHFQAVIVSTAFAGLSRVKRHQLVYGALGDKMREEIHALSMQTLTPDEWSASGPPK
jgi:acid stress-induced BolA-like protein IbaG/YrbA